MNKREVIKLGTKHKYKVRPFELQDEQQVEQLAHWFQENSLYEKAGWSSGKFQALFMSAIDPSSDSFGRVAVDNDGRIVGMFYGFVTEYAFSLKKIANDLVMVFYPDARGTRETQSAMSKMVADFDEWSVTRGAIESCIGATAGTEGKGYVGFLAKRRYRKVGFITKKDLTVGA